MGNSDDLLTCTSWALLPETQNFNMHTTTKKKNNGNIVAYIYNPGSGSAKTSWVLRNVSQAA